MAMTSISTRFGRRWNARRRLGLTLFGVLMGLVLFAAALVGTVTLYTTAQETQARNQSQALLTRLVVAVQQIYLGEAGYPNSSLIPALDARGAIPGNARVVTAAADPDDPDEVSIRHPFGGDVTVTGGVANGARFDIVFEDLENATCANLLDPYVGQARGASGLWEVQVEGTALVSPLTAAAVTENCGNGTNDVTFRFE